MQFPLLNAIKFLLNGKFSISLSSHQPSWVHLMMRNCRQFSRRLFFLAQLLMNLYFHFPWEVFPLQLKCNSHWRISFVEELATICVSIWQFLPHCCIHWIGLNWLWNGCVEGIFHLSRFHFHRRHTMGRNCCKFTSIKSSILSSAWCFNYLANYSWTQFTYSTRIFI